jgi:hypothetical protein
MISSKTYLEAETIENLISEMAKALQPRLNLIQVKIAIHTDPNPLQLVIGLSKRDARGGEK